VIILDTIIVSGLMTSPPAESVVAWLNAQSAADLQGDTDLLGILPKNRTEPENAVSRFLRFQRLTPLKAAGHPGPHGKRR
jgi:hypothetical protein